MARDEQRSVVSDPEAVEAARAFVEETAGRMGLTVTAVARVGDDETVLELVGPDAARAVGRKGATLDALQLLAARVASRRLPENARLALVVDADGWRARRAKVLTRQAEQLGAECVKRAKVIVMEPLPPRERRVVHMALARFPGVTTRSEGDGEERRIQIIPMPAPR